MKFKLPLGETTLSNVIDMMNGLSSASQEFAKDIAKTLAEEGKSVAETVFQNAEYDGQNDVKVSIEEREDGYAIVASGEAVAFIEFGAGMPALAQGGHPYAGELGFGAGSWSMSDQGKGHWNNPEGWFFRDASGNLIRSFGNPPANAFIFAEDAIQRKVEDIEKEWK